MSGQSLSKLLWFQLLVCTEKYHAKVVHIWLVETLQAHLWMTAGINTEKWQRDLSKRAQRARWLPSGPIVISILKIKWDLFLLKNKNLKKVSVTATVSGDVLHPLIPALRKTSDGRATVRERLNDTEQVQEAANLHLGSWPPDGPSYKTVENWIILGL